MNLVVFISLRHELDRRSFSEPPLVETIVCIYSAIIRSLLSKAHFFGGDNKQQCLIPDEMSTGASSRRTCSL